MPAATGLSINSGHAPDPEHSKQPSVVNASNPAAAAAASQGVTEFATEGPQKPPGAASIVGMDSLPGAAAKPFHGDGTAEEAQLAAQDSHAHGSSTAGEAQLAARDLQAHGDGAAEAAQLAADKSPAAEPSGQFGLLSSQPDSVPPNFGSEPANPNEVTAAAEIAQEPGEISERSGPPFEVQKLQGIQAAASQSPANLQASSSGQGGMSPAAVTATMPDAHPASSPSPALPAGFAVPNSVLTAPVAPQSEASEEHTMAEDLTAAVGDTESIPGLSPSAQANALVPGQHGHDTLAKGPAAHPPLLPVENPGPNNAQLLALADAQKTGQASMTPESFQPVGSAAVRADPVNEASVKELMPVCNPESNGAQLMAPEEQQTGQASTATAHFEPLDPAAVQADQRILCPVSGRSYHFGCLAHSAQAQLCGWAAPEPMTQSNGPMQLIASDVEATQNSVEPGDISQPTGQPQSTRPVADTGHDLVQSQAELGRFPEHSHPHPATAVPAEHAANGRHELAAQWNSTESEGHNLAAENPSNGRLELPVPRSSAELEGHNLATEPWAESAAAASVARGVAAIAARGMQACSGPDRKSGAALLRWQLIFGAAVAHPEV